MRTLVFGLLVAFALVAGSPAQAGVKLVRYDCETPTDWAVTCGAHAGKLVVDIVKDLFPLKSLTGAFSVLDMKGWTNLDFTGVASNVMGVYLQSGVNALGVVNNLAACACHQVEVTE